MSKKKIKFFAIVFLVFTFSVSANELNDIISKKEKIAELQEKQKESEYQLAYFFSDNCEYCMKFSPILKKFAEDHHITVRPFSFSGIGLPQFPKPLIATNNIIFHFFGASQITYPQVYMYKRGAFMKGSINIATRAMSYQELDKFWRMAHEPQYLKVLNYE